MRRAAKRDDTERAIVSALRRVGAKVLILEAFDLLVLHQGQLTMLEVKTPKSKAGRIVKQASQEGLERDGWPLNYVTSVPEALAVLGVACQ